MRNMNNFLCGSGIRKMGLLFLMYGGSIALSMAQSSKSVLLINGTAHIGNGQVITHSLIGVREGKIATVANILTTPYDASLYDTVINIEGKHVYPGLIATNITLGLSEVEAVRSTLDFRETGLFTPHVRALVAYNTDSRIIPTVRSNGVLLTQAVPRGGVLSGRSSVMMLEGWNWEDAVYRADEGVHLQWPSFFRRRWQAGAIETSRNDSYQERLLEIRQFFTEAAAYVARKDPERKDLRFEAMRGVFDGTRNLYVHASYVKEITDAVSFCRQLGIARIVLVGGYDAWMVTDLLKENRVSVILRRVHELPVRPEDDVDLPFKLPFLLHKAGVLFCLGGEGDQEASQARNLPFLAGTAAAYGLNREEALMAVTLNAARILGIDKTTGSLEAGKDATLFVSDGDALDMRSNRVTMAFIKGRPLDLRTYQQELYRKYADKYGLP